MLTAGPSAPDARGSGTTASPACAKMSPVDVTMPPACIVGMVGIENPLPPMMGTQPGTLNERRPTVLFHPDAIADHAARNGAAIVLPIPANTRPTPATTPAKNPTTPPHALVIVRTTAPAALLAALKMPPRIAPIRDTSPAKNPINAFHPALMPFTTTPTNARTLSKF